MTEYFAVTVIYIGTTIKKIAYSKYIYNNEIEAMETCQKLQNTPNLDKRFLNFGFEPITLDAKKKVEAGETVYL